jgi:hypothetical protein
VALIQKNGLSDMWRRLNELSFFEKDDTLYVRRSSSQVMFPFVLFSVSYTSFLVSSLLMLSELRLLFTLLSISALLGALVYGALMRQKNRRHGLSPLGTPIVRVDANTLTILTVQWPLRFQIPLSVLRGVSVHRDGYMCIIRCALTDGQVKTARVFHQPDVTTAVADFLRSKLPPSMVVLKINESALW